MRRIKSLTLYLSILVLALTFVSPCFSADAEKININTAPVEELIKLKRIGPKYAEKIVQYREEIGPFKSVEDLAQVKGIGSKTVEVNKDIIVVK